MPLLIEPGDDGLHDDEHFWVALHTPVRAQRHCGMAYRNERGELRLLHLAFHYDLRDEPLRPHYMRVQCGLDRVNQQIVAAFAIAMATLNPQIPYGFNDEGMVFDEDTGALLEAPAGKGLTCATFVVAVLRLLGFPLIDHKTWPDRSEDEDWRQDILAAIEENGGDPDHAAALRASESARRIRPEEVVGASSADAVDWPVPFETAVELAEEILHELAA